MNHVYNFTQGVPDSQSCLDQNKGALEVKGIIYAIWCSKSRKIYIGQTINSAIQRFQEHFRAARDGANLPLYDAIRNLGLNPFFIFPLEKIVYIDHPDSDTRLANFTLVAYDREKFWINHLKSWKPLGYNTIWSARRKRCRHSKRNPMKRFRQPKDKLPNDMDHMQNRIWGYRNWYRRSIYLLTKIRKNTWEDTILLKYKSKNLKQIRDFLQRCIYLKNPIGSTFMDIELLLEKIRSKILLPDTYHKNKPKITKPLILKLEWNECMLQNIPVKKHILEAKDFPIGGNDISSLLQKSLIIAKKLTPPLGDIACNHRGAAKSFNKHKVPSEKCPCRKLFNAKFRPNEECVFTMDTSIAENPILIDLFNEGTGYRERIASNMTQDLRDGLDNLISTLEQKLHKPALEFRQWKENIIDSIVPLLKNAPKNKSDLEMDDVKNSYKFLKKWLVLCPTDKAAKNFTFICRNLYQFKLHQELSSDEGAYVQSNLTPKEILDNYVSDLYSIGRSKIPFNITRDMKALKGGKKQIKLPLLYWLPKMHKSPPKPRFIAGSAKVITTSLAKVVNTLLIFIKDELLEKDRQHIIKTGVKRCWFVNSHDEVCRWLKNIPRPKNPQLKCVNTFDFSTMYTTLVLDDIVNSVKASVEEAFEGHKFVALSGSSVADWIGDDSEPPKTGTIWYEVNEVVHLVKVLVRNTFIQNGNIIKKQEVGLPMGTNPAPAIADLTCYPKEAKFMDEIARHSLALARRFIGSFRFIDDIMSCDNPSFSQHVLLENVPSDITTNSKIYPPFLLLNQTNEVPTSATYLGMEITSKTSNFHVNVANSDKKFPFPKISYPSLNGNFPKVLGYGIYTGQLHRFSTICTDHNDFLNNTIKLAKTLIPKGYVKRHLYQKLCSFIQTSTFTYKFPRSVIAKSFRHSLRFI
jgi:hypothetical protein